MKLTDWLNKLSTDKNTKRYLLIFLCLGILLMLLPTGTTEECQITQTETTFRVDAEEKRLADTLSRIEGVGACEVLLSVYSSEESVLAQDGEETVVISEEGGESAVTVLTKYPRFQGAVIVAGGCEDAHVRFDILSAVMSYTGLGADKITICPIES